MLSTEQRYIQVLQDVVKASEREGGQIPEIAKCQKSRGLLLEGGPAHIREAAGAFSPALSASCASASGSIWTAYTDSACHETCVGLSAVNATPQQQQQSTAGNLMMQPAVSA